MLTKQEIKEIHGETEAEQAGTSRRIIPTVMKQWELGPVNLDWGGGKWPDATKYLEKHNVRNRVYDKYWQTAYEAAEVKTWAKYFRVDTITCLNVLNVITDKEERKELYESMREILEHQQRNFTIQPTIIFQIFEKGVTRVQVKKTAEYFIDEIQEAFPEWEAQLISKDIIVL